jgi:4'-phosphopantetheinyl transferase EntD
MAARHSRVPACAKSLPDLLAYNGYGPAKRYPWETPEQYRSRRRAQNKMRDEYLKGRCVHASSALAMATDETGKPLGLGKVILYGAYRKDT